MTGDYAFLKLQANHELTETRRELEPLGREATRLKSNLEEMTFDICNTLVAMHKGFQEGKKIGEEEIREIEEDYEGDEEKISEDISRKLANSKRNSPHILDEIGPDLIRYETTRLKFIEILDNFKKLHKSEILINNRIKLLDFLEKRQEIEADKELTKRIMLLTPNAAFMNVGEISESKKKLLQFVRENSSEIPQYIQEYIAEWMKEA